MNDNLLLDIYNNTINGDASDSLVSFLKTSEGRYLELTEIASGGMKTIHSCIDAHTDRDIILLTPLKPSLNELFIREAFINAYLQHPNITPVYDVGLLDDGRPFFTSKLIKGSNLKELSPSEDELIDIVIKICEAVSYAHSRSVVHQDLKPENIMIDTFGEVIIIDWGLAEIEDSEITGESSILDKEQQKLKFYSIPEESRTLRGTPGYIAPERYKGSKVSVQNDIYSIGALLYEKVSGKSKIEYPLLFENEVSISVKAVCEKALNPSVGKRYQTVNELLDDLQRYRHGYATIAESATPWRVLSLLYHRNKKFCLLSISAFVLIVVITVLSFVAINESKNQAVKEKDKAIKANDENKRLLEALQEKEKNRLHFMRLTAENQLGKIKGLLRQGKISETEIMLESTLKLDPESRQNNLFKAQFEFANHRLDEAVKYYEMLQLKDEVEFIKNLDMQNPKILLSQMPKISKFLEGDLGALFCQNSLELSDKVETKAELYEWLLFFKHPGMKRLPKVFIEQKSDGIRVSLSNNYSMLDCGPIHLLKPQHLDLSNTYFRKINLLENCQNLISLNLRNTPLVALSGLTLHSLKELDISETEIKKVEAWTMPNLERLKVSKTDYSQFRFIKNFKNLKVLVVDKGQAKRISKKEGIEIIVED